jgi:hypothetical protein
MAADAHALPDERDLYTPSTTFGGFFGDLFSSKFMGDIGQFFRKSFPAMLRMGVLSLLETNRYTKILSDFFYFGYDVGAIKPYEDDPIHEHLEIVVNERDQILGYRIYSDDSESSRYSRPLRDTSDFLWTGGGIRDMNLDSFSNMSGGRLRPDLAFDPSFESSGGAHRLTDGDYNRTQGVQEILIEYQLVHLTRDRPDLRKSIGLIPDIPDRVEAYSITVPKSDKAIYDPNAFDWGLFYHNLRGFGKYFILNRTLFRAVELFDNWAKKVLRTDKDLIPKDGLKDMQIAVAYKDRLPKYNIPYG